MNAIGFMLKERIIFAVLLLFSAIPIILGLHKLLSLKLNGVVLGLYDGKLDMSFQVTMWVAFIWGLLLVARQYVDCHFAQKHLEASYLPADEDVVLQAPDLRRIFTFVKRGRVYENGYLPSLIYQAIVQYQTSKSIEQTANIVTTQLSLLHDQVDSRYSMIRYMTWLLPTLGFTGTVYGISVTVATVGSMSAHDPALLKTVAQNLAVAFDTTLVALVQSAILIFLMTVVQTKEETVLNQSGQVCLSNFVNRIYKEK